MAPSIWLLAALALPLSAFADEGKYVPLSFERRETWSGTGKQPLRKRGSDNVNVYNAQSSLLYLVNVTVGTPGQKMSLQLDTGSSDIWIPWAQSSICTASGNACGDNGDYNQASSSTYNLLQANSFLISYVDGTRIKGDYISDVFGIGSANIKNMTMGLAKSASQSSDSGDFQGIVGVGYETSEAVYAQSGQTYNNLPTQMMLQNVTNTRAYSLWLNDKENGKGTILFGAIDTAKFKAPLVSLPIQPDSRTGTLVSFTVALDNFNVIGGSNKTQYTKSSLALPVILDSGTTLTYLPDNIAQDLYNGVGALQSSTYGIVVPCDLSTSPATFNFGFGNSNGPVVVVPISALVLPFPDSFPAPTFRSTGKKACRWGIQAAGSRPNLFGDTFLRAAYVVYNLDNNEIGIANAVLNATNSNIQEITGKNIPGVSSTASGAVAKQTASGIYGVQSYTYSAGSGQLGTASASGTFDLGPTTAVPGSSSSSSSSPGKKGAATSIHAPRLPVLGAIAGFVSTLALLGGAMIFGMQWI